VECLSHGAQRSAEVLRESVQFRLEYTEWHTSVGEDCQKHRGDADHDHRAVLALDHRLLELVPDA